MHWENKWSIDFLWARQKGQDFIEMIFLLYKGLLTAKLLWNICHGNVYIWELLNAENIYSTPGCIMLMVHPRIFSPNEQNERMSEWANEQNEQKSKHFYSFKKMSKHFYINEQIEQMSKWAKCPYEQIWCQMST